ncbi:MAG: Hsp20/alpha crystallin family protein [Gemmataceae bacterium]
MNTTRLLPNVWASLDRLHGEVDRLLEGWGVELPQLALTTEYPPVNVWEDAEAFHVMAEVPGMTEDNLTVAVTHRNQVSIQGERKADEVARGRWHRRERGFGRFQRVLKLPAAVDADKVEARIDNGVLQLTLPKAEEARPRKIVVKQS